MINNTSGPDFDIQEKLPMSKLYGKWRMKDNTVYIAG